VGKNKTNSWRESHKIEDTILHNFVGTVIKKRTFEKRPLSSFFVSVANARPNYAVKV